MLTAKAWERLNDPNYGGTLNKEDYYHLCKEAGLNEEAAQKAATERAQARQDKGLPI